MPSYVPITMYGLRLFTLFIELFTWFLIRGRGFYHFTKFHCSTPSSSEIAKCIAWGCLLFTRTTLFTTMFTVIIVVCLLKSIHIPSFILIGCCVSELHGHIS